MELPNQNSPIMKYFVDDDNDYDYDDDDDDDDDDDGRGGDSVASSEPFTTHRFDQQKVDRGFLKWVITAKDALRTVDHPAFLDLVNDLSPHYKVPTREIIENKILEMFSTDKDKLKKIMSGSRVSLTTNTWTSGQDIVYLLVTAHFLDDDWKLQKKIIAFEKITSHEGEDLGKVLATSLDDWGIKNIFSITVDDAIAKYGLIEYMKKRLDDQGSLLCGGIYLHMRCTRHIINLMVKDSMKELFPSIERIRNCVQYTRSLPTRLNAFRTFAISEKMDGMAIVPLDAVTRWNRTFKMIKCAYSYRSVFGRMVIDDDAFKEFLLEKYGPPTDGDWQKASSFVHFLEKFNEVITKLSATNTPTSHLVLIMVLVLLKDILMAVNDDSNITLQSAAKSMKRKFEKYWGSIDEVCPIIFVAQVLDPTLKLDMIAILLTLMDASEAKIEETKDKVKRNLNALYTEYKDRGWNQEIPRETVLYDDDGDDKADVSLIVKAYRLLARKRKASHSTESTNEVDNYLNDASESLNNPNFDLLEWWKTNSMRYPVLSMVARDVFAIPSSSVASGNVFNLGRRVVDPFKASLAPKTLEALVCTSDWLGGEDFHFQQEPQEDDIEFYKELEEIERGVTTL